MIRILTAAALLAGLAACNTVEGVGRDLSASGEVIADTANHARPVYRAPDPYYRY